LLRKVVIALLATGLVATSAGCAPEPAAAATEKINWLQLETGKQCAQAKVACGIGNCAANLTNSCRLPVTCKLRIECLCRALTGEEGPASAESTQTIPVGDRLGISTRVLCDDGEVLATLARNVSCF
jgi:hypothetical protein